VAGKEIGLEINADKAKHTVMSGRITVHRLIIAPLKEWKNSNIWEQPYQIKIIFKKKSIAD
jgi:hypothetical protein